MNMNNLGKWCSEDPIGMVKALVGYTNQAMALKYENWRRYRKKVRNERHIIRSTDAEAPLYSTNFMRRKQNTALSYLQDNIPQVSIRGVELDDDDAARYKQRLVDWAKSNQQLAYDSKVMKAANEVFITGSGFIKVRYDMDADIDDIGVRWDILSPETVKVDPLCGGDMHNARWVIHERRAVPIDELRYQFTKNISPAGDLDTTGAWIPAEKEATGNVYEGTTTVWESYIKDYSTELIDEAIEDTDEEGNIISRVVKRRVRKYPKWRLLIICDGYDKPLYDGNLPYGYEDIPLIPLPYEEDANTIYPISLMEIVEPLQDKSDQLEKQIFKNIRLVVNRQRKLGAGSGLKKSDITSIPGDIFEMMDISQLVWDEPTQLSADIFNYSGLIPGTVNAVSGIYEITEGRSEAGVTAYSAIVTLKDASTATIRKVTRIIADAFCTAFIKTIQLIRAYKPSKFVIKTVGGNLNIIDEYPETLQLMGPDGEIINIPIDEADSATKIAWKEMNGVHVVLADINEKTDFIVSGDNVLPSSKAQRARVNLDLFDRRVIDAEALLEAMDYPGRAEILRRQKAALEQQIMMMQQQQQTPGGMQVMGGETTKLSESHSVPLLPELVPARSQEKI